jgi:hypothetical protein
MATQVLSQVFNPQARLTPIGESGGAPPSPFAGGAREKPSRHAARLDSLEGKTLYLIDSGFGGSNKFLEQLSGWFARNMPSVTTVQRRKTGNIFADDTSDLWTEIKEKGHAVIMGVAG